MGISDQESKGFLNLRTSAGATLLSEGVEGRRTRGGKDMKGKRGAPAPSSVAVRLEDQYPSSSITLEG